MKKIKQIVVGGMILALLVRSITLSTVDVSAMEITSATTISEDLVESIIVSTPNNGMADNVILTIDDGVNVSGNIDCGSIYTDEGDTVTIYNYGTIAGVVRASEGMVFDNYGQITKLNITTGDVTLYGGTIDELLVDGGSLEMQGSVINSTATFNNSSGIIGNGYTLYVNAGLNMNTTQATTLPIAVGTDTYITPTYDVTVRMDGCGEFFIPAGTTAAKFGELFSCSITGAGLDMNFGRMMGNSSMTGGNYTVFTNTGILPLSVEIGSLDSDYYTISADHSSGDVLNPSEALVLDIDTKPGLASGTYSDTVELELSGFLYTVHISHEFVETSGSAFIFDGTVGDNDFYTSDVTISAGDGFSIAYSQSTDFVKSLTFYDGEYEIFLDAKHDATGTLMEQNCRYVFTIDTKAPVIKGVENGKEYYTEAQELTVSDAHLGAVTINLEPIGMVDDTLVLSSNQGVEVYEVVAKDMAGNKTTVKVVVLAEWVQSGVVPCDTTISLQDEYEYNFGKGTYNVEGDTTSYAGGGSFYVRGDGKYTFTKE